MSATILDVAHRAGVSQGTVSVIYNHGPRIHRISEATRLRVEQAIRDLKYHPNVSARSISRKRFETIGVGLDVSSGRRGAFSLNFINGIDDVCDEQDYLFVMSRAPATEKRVPKFLRARCIDGYLAFLALSPEAYARARDASLPVLLVNATNWCNYPTVNFDDCAAMRLALDSLEAKGHRRIAYLSCLNTNTHYSRNDRLNAYLDWTRSRGCPELVHEGGWHHAEQFVAWIRSLLAGPDPVTALLCYNCNAALWALDTLNGIGVKVPEDLSLAAFSIPSPEPEQIAPPLLAGIEYDMYETGRIAAAEMIDALTANRQLRSHRVLGQWRDGPTIREI